MMLLRFSAENHKALRDRVELDMVSSTLRTQRPKDGDWASVVHPVAGIFGANASGKSTILNAMAYAQAAVRLSATSWLQSKRTPRKPFLLDVEHPRLPSTYSFDMVIAGIRYEYGFSLSADGIDAEWLIDYPNGRRRLLFDRVSDRDEPFEFGRALSGSAGIAAAVSRRELLLSRAAVLEQSDLARVASAITEDIELALFGHPFQQQRIGAIVDALREGTTTFDEIITLLRVADIGIESISIREEEVPERVRKLFATLNDSLRKSRPEGEGSQEAGGTTEIAIDEVMHHLEFFHRGRSGENTGLGLDDESTGTISWLSLAVPAVEALRNGSVLLVDEIDASLHPQLSSVLIGMFLDRELNRKGAQLVFTSHDTFLLSPQAEAPLSAEQVWFTEKAADGSVELFSLADFPNRKADNVARRYLAGRYGAVPRPVPSLLRGLLDEREER